LFALMMMNTPSYRLSVGKAAFFCAYSQVFIYGDERMLFAMASVKTA
jgi:hypothetical protein